MIELTVKTLDSQNHAFSVDDDITVAQFKEKVAEKINIPPETQRIIYCGRVLKDDHKLGEYDVNGKVVHLVQRAPPSVTQRRSRSTSPQAQRSRRGMGHHGHGNTMYVGSMSFPANLVEGIEPPLSHSLTVRRLNVAGRMLTLANDQLAHIENPQATPPPVSQPTAEERVLFEPNDASFEDWIDRMERVIDSSEGGSISDTSPPSGSPQLVVIPPSQVGGATISVTLSSSDVPAQQQQPQQPPPPPPPSSSATTAPTTRAGSSESTTDSSPPVSGTATPEEGAAATGETAAGATRPTNGNISRTSVMAEHLTTLENIHTRFAPILARYHTFMQEDPVVAPEEVASTQRMLDQVSEVLHTLGHAYHSLSDILVNVNTAPPRPLLCCPILMQSGVVQTGLAMQVESQINLGGGRNGLNTPNPTTETPSTPTTNTNPARPPLRTPYNIQFRDTPFTMGGAGATPTAPSGGGAAGQPIRGNTAGGTIRTMNIPLQATFGIPMTAGAAAGVVGAGRPSSGGTTGGAGGGQTGGTAEGAAATGGTAGGGGGTGPNNVEYYMELTDSITIDSLGGVVDGIPTEMLRNALNPTPALVQSLLQMAGHLMHRQIPTQQQPTSTTANNTSTTNNTTSSTNNTTTSSTNNTTSSSVNTTTSSSSTNNTTTAAGTAAGTAATNGTQNSTARGNTQTNPTTATRTRSTARPHGGPHVHVTTEHVNVMSFDPFLRCSSHVLQRGGGGGGGGAAEGRRVGSEGRGRSGADGGVNLAATATFNMERRGDRVIPTMVHIPSDVPQQSHNAIYNILQGIMTNIQQAVNPGSASASAAAPSASAAPQQQQQTTAGSDAGSGGNSTAAPAGAAAGSGTSSSTSGGLPMFATFLPHLQNMNLGGMNFSGPTLAQLLQNVPNDNYVEGVSILDDFIQLLSRLLTIGDIIQLYSGRLESLVRIHPEIRTFVLNRIIDNSTDAIDATDRGTTRILDEMEPFLENLSLLSVRNDIDIVASAIMLFRLRLPSILLLAVCPPSPANSRRLADQVTRTARHLLALVQHASSNGTAGIDRVIDHMLSRYMESFPEDIRRFTIRASHQHIMQFMSTLNVPTQELQHYIIKKNTQRNDQNGQRNPIVEMMRAGGGRREGGAATSGAASETSATGGSTASAVKVDASTETVKKQSTRPVEAMELDDEGPVGSSSSELGELDNNSLPEEGDVIIGSESWHSQVPSGWVPIIARDAQRQRRLSRTEPALSDAYLAGMPSKRRKIVTDAKPQGSLSQVITDSVRRAVNVAGLSNVTNVENVAATVGGDVAVQSAYRDLLRTTVTASIPENEDFTAERFPNATKYFSKPS